jgi:hypothetical protein
MDKDWVVVYSIGQQHLAEMAKKMLADHNITSVIINKKDSSYLSFGDIELYVRKEDEDKAKSLIKDFEN